MIKSMTAFARQDREGDWGQLSCEIRSVNHRYLEPQFRLPEGLRELEPLLREQLRTALGRGKVEVNLRWQAPEQTSTEVVLDRARVSALYRAAREIESLMASPAPMSPLDLLGWPGVMVESAPSLEPVKLAARDLFAATLSDLEQSREREGQRLLPMLTDRLAAMDAQVAHVRERMPQILAQQQRQLRERLEAVVSQVDPERLAQELVMVSQKADVAEELDRLDAHGQEVRDTLAVSGPVGRRLDFLMQELNREANTLSSKSLSADITTCAVALKVLIEQMREQVQNLE
ncbi:MAG: YicC/YloC family endoribonuclease [Oleiphilaceae bacterium]|nr:YicC/YloC family endoribonuclease [Oleiphilaceae bacterium]